MTYTVIFFTILTIQLVITIGVGYYTGRIVKNKGTEKKRNRLNEILMTTAIVTSLIYIIFFREHVTTNTMFGYLIQYSILVNTCLALACYLKTRRNKKSKVLKLVFSFITVLYVLVYGVLINGYIEISGLMG